MREFPRLHDAILQNIRFDWEAGTLWLCFQIGPLPSDREIIKALGVTDLNCPRGMPWGPSSSVNGARAEEFPEGRVIEIEMQSGDLLRIHCGGVVYESEVEEKPKTQESFPQNRLLGNS